MPIKALFLRAEDVTLPEFLWLFEHGSFGIQFHHDSEQFFLSDFYWEATICVQSPAKPQK